LGREVTGRVPVLNRFESFKKPTFNEWGQALRPNPQLQLFRNTPKLADSALSLPVGNPSPFSGARVVDVPPGSGTPPEMPARFLDVAPPRPPAPPPSSPTVTVMRPVETTQAFSPQPLAAPPEPGSGTFSRDPRTGAELIQGVKGLSRGGQGKVAF